MLFAYIFCVNVFHTRHKKAWVRCNLLINNWGPRKTCRINKQIQKPTPYKYATKSMPKGINTLSMQKVYKYTREHLFILFPILRLKFPRFQSLETSVHRRFFVNMSLITTYILWVLNSYHIILSAKSSAKVLYFFEMHNIVAPFWEKYVQIFNIFIRITN